MTGHVVWVWISCLYVGLTLRGLECDLFEISVGWLPKTNGYYSSSMSQLINRCVDITKRRTKALRHAKISRNYNPCPRHYGNGEMHPVALQQYRKVLNKRSMKRGGVNYFEDSMSYPHWQSPQLIQFLNFTKNMEGSGWSPMVWGMSRRKRMAEGTSKKKAGHSRNDEKQLTSDVAARRRKTTAATRQKLWEEERIRIKNRRLQLKSLREQQRTIHDQERPNINEKTRENRGKYIHNPLGGGKEVRKTTKSNDKNKAHSTKADEPARSQQRNHSSKGSKARKGHEKNGRSKAMGTAKSQKKSRTRKGSDRGHSVSRIRTGGGTGEYANEKADHEGKKRYPDKTATKSNKAEAEDSEESNAREGFSDQFISNKQAKVKSKQQEVKDLADKDNEITETASKKLKAKTSQRDKISRGHSSIETTRQSSKKPSKGPEKNNGKGKSPGNHKFDEDEFLSRVFGFGLSQRRAKLKNQGWYRGSYNRQKARRTHAGIRAHAQSNLYGASASTSVF